MLMSVTCRPMYIDTAAAAAAARCQIVFNYVIALPRTGGDVIVTSPRRAFQYAGRCEAIDPHLSRGDNSNWRACGSGRGLIK